MADSASSVPLIETNNFVRSMSMREQQKKRASIMSELYNEISSSSSEDEDNIETTAAAVNNQSFEGDNVADTSTSSQAIKKALSELYGEDSDDDTIGLEEADNSDGSDEIDGPTSAPIKNENEAEKQKRQSMVAKLSMWLSKSKTSDEGQDKVDETRKKRITRKLNQHIASNGMVKVVKYHSELKKKQIAQPNDCSQKQKMDKEPEAEPFDTMEHVLNK